MNKVNKCFLLLLFYGFIFMNYTIGQQEFDNAFFTIQNQESDNIQVQYDTLQKMYKILLRMSTELRGLKIQYDSADEKDEELKQKMIQLSARYLAFKKLYDNHLSAYNDLLAEQHVDMEDESAEVE